MAKNSFLSRLILLTLLFCQLLHVKAADEDWDVTSSYSNDSLTIKLVAKDTKQQLAVLMQGLHVALPSAHLSVVFPSAPMVRNKMKHHPNEVKAMMRKDSANVEVKPDLFPLIEALSDTTATVCDSIQGKKELTHNFTIELDKENAILYFTVVVPFDLSILQDTVSIRVDVSSAPGGLSSRKEFTGSRLSKEEGPVKNGLGHASMGKDDKNRTVQFQRSVNISGKF